MGEVVPAVGFEDGPVHRGVQRAELEDVGRGLVWIVEPVVRLRQPLVVSDHPRGAELVGLAASGFESRQLAVVSWRLVARRVLQQACGQRKVHEAVCWRILKIVLQSSTKKPTPRFMNTGLKNTGLYITFTRNGNHFVVNHSSNLKESKRERIAVSGDA